jgi:NAD(P)-dependent dehydrogenase (short-subunit alcohol dehydrogenase family)
MSVLDRFSLKGRTAIVTGGERGIGREIAVAFSELGANIAIAGMDIDAAKGAKELIEKNGVRAIFIETDVTDEKKAQNAVQKTVDEFGKLDILVNNAGMNKSINAEEMPAEVYRKIIDVNMTSQFIMSKAAAKFMIPQNKGSILNVASMSAYAVNRPQCQVAYNSSKAGVVMITKSLATEWAKYNIRVNAIAPGYMLTPLTKHRFEGENPVTDTWLELTPMGRVGTPDELTGMAVCLVSDASTFTTGSVVVIDGGYSCW